MTAHNSLSLLTTTLQPGSSWCRIALAAKTSFTQHRGDTTSLWPQAIALDYGCRQPFCDQRYSMPSAWHTRYIPSSQPTHTSSPYVPFLVGPVKTAVWDVSLRRATWQDTPRRT